MKKASAFEKIAARCWNLLNEGKPFTPIFTIGTMVLFFLLFQREDFGAFLLSFTLVIPLFVLFFVYDFPLFLRNYLWVPFIAYLLLWNYSPLYLLLFSIGLYFFFTVFFWGTLYYHLRIGTTWLNFTRFWKLVLKNSDSTSGNAQEQIPKFLLLLSLWDFYFFQFKQGVAFVQIDWMMYSLFFIGLLLYTYILHHHLFDWKPKVIPSYTNNVQPQAKAVNEKVLVIVIDGMRKERFNEANTPFLDGLRNAGTEYTNMETVYPARTVVCFSSMFTGTYPFEHGITSNMVWKLGIKVESIFDSLRKVGKKGRLLGIAHLVDSMGDDVETVTAVMKHDEADPNIMKRAKLIMDEQDPDLFVVQLIGTDQIGHSRGVLYDDYIEKIEEADRLIKDFIEDLTAQGKMENTTIIVCADHGQADGIGGHGHLDEGERYVPFFIHGPHVHKGKKVEEKHSLVSIAPTISYLLGAPFPNKSRGPVLLDAFKREES